MDEAAEVRGAAREAVSDVVPPRLRDDLVARVDEGWPAPGVLTLLSARAAADGAVEGAAERAAAVQLVYEGLSLTRRLVYEEPWVEAGGAPADTVGTAQAAPTEADEGANLDVVAADVLIARGESLLARTEAADRSVEILRTFGRDQTACDPSRPIGGDRRLEAEMFELAVVAGSTLARSEPPRRLLEWAHDLATTLPAESLPEPSSLVDRDEVPSVAGRTPAPAGEGTTSTDP